MEFTASVRVPGATATSTDDSVSAVLQQTTTFYREQLDHYPEAMRYLHQRGLQDPALIKQLQIGYAPGGSLRRHLTAQGYGFDLLRQFGLLNSQGSDAFYQRIVFPLRHGQPIVN